MNQTSPICMGDRWWRRITVRHGPDGIGTGRIAIGTMERLVSRAGTEGQPHQSPVESYPGSRAAE